MKKLIFLSIITTVLFCILFFRSQKGKTAETFQPSNQRFGAPCRTNACGVDLTQIGYRQCLGLSAGNAWPGCRTTIHPIPGAKIVALCDLIPTGLKNPNKISTKRGAPCCSIRGSVTMERTLPKGRNRSGLLSFGLETSRSMRF